MTSGWTAAGWYWCRNIGDHPSEMWEAIVRLDIVEGAAKCSWMSAPGEVGTMYDADFSPTTEWIGPMLEPWRNP